MEYNGFYRLKSDIRSICVSPIENIPDTAKLVILVGPSGSGKSSLFEVINVWGKDQRNSIYDPEYLLRDGEPVGSRSRLDFSALGITINADDPLQIWEKPVICVQRIGTLQSLVFPQCLKLMRVNICN